MKVGMIEEHNEEHKLSCLLNFRDSDLHLYNWNALKQIETN